MMLRAVKETVAEAFEEACMSLSVGMDADQMNATVGDAIAHWRHETDLSGAREQVYDQSGDAADAIIKALTEAGFEIVPTTYRDAAQSDGSKQAQGE